MTTSTTNANPPVDRVRIGNIQASVWRNIDEHSKSRYSILIDRHYTDRSGKWQVTNSYSVADLPTLAKVADLACERVCELQEMDRDAAQAA